MRLTDRTTPFLAASNNDTARLTVLAVAMWFWNDSARTREQTLKYCRDACGELSIQLLEETVVLARTRRDAQGRRPSHIEVRQWVCR